MRTINFNYSLTINQATKINNIADEMKGTANNQFQNAIESITACWSGEASQKFIEQCSELQSGIIAQANRLYSVAEDIQKRANVIKKAEEDALAQLKSNRHRNF